MAFSLIFWWPWQKPAFTNITIVFCFLLKVYETLEHRLLVAEASQRLRLPLLSKDGQVREEEILKCIITSRSSLDSSTSLTNTLANTSSSGAASTTLPLGSSDSMEDTIGGVPNRFLGITASYLQQCQSNLHHDLVVCFTLLELSPYQHQFHW